MSFFFIYLLYLSTLFVIFLYRFNNNIILRLSYEMNDRVKREREIKIKKFISFFFLFNKFVFYF